MVRILFVSTMLKRMSRKRKNKTFKKKKKYAAIVKLEREQPYKWRFDSVYRLERFFLSKHPNWRYYSLYNNLTKDFIKRVTSQDFKQRKYKCGVKINELLQYWHTDNLLSFVSFLDKQHSSWKWFNVYNTKTGVQLSSFTKYKRPTNSTI